MPSKCSRFLALILTVGVIALSASAAPVATPLGVVIIANQAQVGNSQAAGGSTIFSGDKLVTAENGNLQVRIGGTQARLLPGTLAIINTTDAGLSADLLSGSVNLTSAAGEKIFIVANHAIVRPVTASAVVAQVTRLNPNELLLSATQGSLEVTYNSEVQMVPAGTSYRMLVDPDPAGGPGQAGATPAGRTGKTRKRALFILGGAAAAATGIGIMVTSSSSPVSPSTP
jgi:hypothetical protein